MAPAPQDRSKGIIHETLQARAKQGQLSDVAVNEAMNRIQMSLKLEVWNLLMLSQKVLKPLCCCGTASEGSTRSGMCLKYHFVKLPDCRALLFIRQQGMDNKKSILHAKSDFVIEAVEENEDTKKSIFRRLDQTLPRTEARMRPIPCMLLQQHAVPSHLLVIRQVAPVHALLASSTSSISISRLANATTKPHRVAESGWQAPWTPTAV
eukprot:scaffold30342_cov16-Tisochrysis_lutea.AAC.1